MSPKTPETLSTISSTSTTSLKPTTTPDPRGCSLPKSHPSRTLYLTLRTISSLLGGILIVLAIIAKHVLDRPQWLSPILSPAINALCTSTIDILLVLWKDKRAPRLQRLLYDGAIGVGCGVAGGFLVAFTLGDVRGTREGGWVGTAAVGVLILGCMFGEVLVHLWIGVDAGLEMFQVRRAARRNVV